MFCHRAKNDPRPEGGSGNENPAMGFGFFCFWRFGFWGVDGAQIAGTIYILYICVYICAFPKKKSGKSKIFTGCSELIRISDTLSQSIGRGRISHVGSLVVFRIGIVVRESRDCGVIKFPQKDPTILAWFFLKNAVCIISRKIAVLAAEAPTFVCVWGGRY